MISPEVMQELLAVRKVLHYLPESQSTEKRWTSQEQHLFWVAVTKYPQGPWSAIAKYIGTKTTRQAMTHAQKLRQKLKRWNSRLRRNPAVSSLMDEVVVIVDSNVVVPESANSTLSLEASVIPPASSLTRVAPPSKEQQRGSKGLPDELESKDHEQHGMPCTTVRYTATSTFSRHDHYNHPAQPPIFDRYHQVPFSTAHVFSEDRAFPTSIPPEFVDELAKSLLGEGSGDNDVTEK
ncbi:Myb-like DNA-binding domain [Phytophthora infestans]|uniref:Myb-like DNA-binding domain n=1 Tax=Phytophthora infestans TaxID=4787 RepID=A0A833T5N6_PHYIN|nr:Myb-like DNA-binding domain [Phytophthora infestans]KAF4127887.1 Myb-like DNA-binding domain [Phytophthora infestans]